MSYSWGCISLYHSSRCLVSPEYTRYPNYKGELVVNGELSLCEASFEAVVPSKWNRARLAGSKTVRLISSSPLGKTALAMQMSFPINERLAAFPQLQNEIGRTVSAVVFLWPVTSYYSRSRNHTYRIVALAARSDGQLRQYFSVHGSQWNCQCMSSPVL